MGKLVISIFLSIFDSELGGTLLAVQMFSFVVSTYVSNVFDGFHIHDSVKSDQGILSKQTHSADLLCCCDFIGY